MDIQLTNEEMEAIAWSAYTTSGNPDAKAARVLLDLVRRILNEKEKK